MPHAAPTHPSHAADAGLTASLRGLLRQLDDLLANTSPQQYADAPPAHLQGTLGGHVRHTLDHIATLAAAPTNPTLDYDHRDRHTDIELQPHAARAAIARLAQQLTDLDALDVDAPLSACLMLTPDGPPRDFATTLGREVAFVLNHTLHHQALIAAHLRATGHHVPDNFGVAPATLQHRAN